MQAYEVYHSWFEAHNTCNSGLHTEAFIFVLCLQPQLPMYWLTGIKHQRLPVREWPMQALPAAGFCVMALMWLDTHQFLCNCFSDSVEIVKSVRVKIGEKVVK